MFAGFLGIIKVWDQDFSATFAVGMAQNFLKNFTQRVQIARAVEVFRGIAS